jgi:biofilm PGA synthesis N-glycosyltransferase PgaC
VPGELKRRDPIMHREYVLISPARNEESQIEHTLRSVLAQTLRPRCWVIVNDGSTDRTAEIVDRYARENEFITLVHADRRHHLGFGSKVRAFETGYATLVKTPYAFIGNLDADVSFGPNYFERLLGHFDANPKLGLGGGIILEKIDNQFVPQKISSNSVAGAVQLFRRECYEQIGGYIPLQYGGIDSVAEIMARMYGWTVRTFSELPVEHHGRITTGKHSIFRTRFNKGLNSYLIGYHPLFHLVVSLFRSTTRPYVMGSLMMMAGYGWAALRQKKRPVPPEFVSFLQSEQLARLRGVIAPGGLGKLANTSS